MNRRGELAAELERILSEGRVPQLLGEWVARNGTEIIEALRMANGMVINPHEQRTPARRRAP